MFVQNLLVSATLAHSHIAEIFHIVYTPIIHVPPPSTFPPKLLLVHTSPPSPLHAPLLPNAEPPLHPSPPHTILIHIIPRIFHILLAPLFRLPDAFQTVLLPLLHILGLLQPLLVRHLALVRNVHPVDVDGAAG